MCDIEILRRIVRIVIQSVGLARLPDFHVERFGSSGRPVDDLHRRSVAPENLSDHDPDRFQQFLLFAENQRIEGDFVFVQNAFGVESGQVVQSAERTEPRMRHDDIGHGLVVKRFPVSFVGRADRNEFRIVGFFGILDHKHDLSGLSCKALFGCPDDLIGILFVVYVSVEHHNTRELKRIVEPADVGRQSVMFECRFVILVMKHGA